MQIIQWLTQVTPSPSPSATPDFGGLLDFKDVLSNAAGGLITAGIVALLGLISSVIFSTRARQFYGRCLTWIFRRPQPPSTPPEARTPRTLTAKSYHRRRFGVPTSKEVEADDAEAESRAAVREWVSGPGSGQRNMKALGRSLKATQLSEIAKSSQLRLPASWRIQVDWKHLGGVQIENVGPGDASHVLIRSSVSEAVIRNGYFADFPKDKLHTFNVDPGEWLVGEDFYLELSWVDEGGERQSQHVYIPKAPH